MDVVECVVVGAGVVGLAAARELALRGRDVIVLEAATVIGGGISSRSSEVIHAGVYYPAGSLKAQLCVEGARELYAFCRSRGVVHRRCGKLIVAATAAQLEDLAAIEGRAHANGVDDLMRLDRSEALAMEPELACAAALYSPSTGILDSHAYMLALQGEAEARGAAVAFASRVEAVTPGTQGLVVRIGGGEGVALACRLVVNAAGLGAHVLANSLGRSLGEAVERPLYLAKGSYFSLRGRSPFTRLIYPVPEPGGLGVHLTLDLGGQARFGPDVEWVQREDFVVDPARAARFYDSIRTYWPGLEDGALAPAYSGVRPKLNPPGAPAADFLVEAQGAGAGVMINLLGVESPGLTASLALARHVADLAEGAAAGLSRPRG